MRFTTLRFLFVVLILSLPSPVPAAEPKQEFEQLFEKLFQAAEEKGHSRNEIINVFKGLRNTQYQLLQAKTQTKLEALLSQDTLYIGPLSTVDDEYRSLSRQQLQSQATTIASSLLDAHVESKDGVMKTLRDLRKKFGVNNEFGTCSRKQVHSIEVQLVKLSTLAELFDFRIEKERGVRTFNETFHRIKTEVEELQAMFKLDCMIAVFISRS